MEDKMHGKLSEIKEICSFFLHFTKKMTDGVKFISLFNLSFILKIEMFLIVQT